MRFVEGYQDVHALVLGEGLFELHLPVLLWYRRASVLYKGVLHVAAEPVLALLPRLREPGDQWLTRGFLQWGTGWMGREQRGAGGRNRAGGRGGVIEGGVWAG